MTTQLTHGLTNGRYVLERRLVYELPLEVWSARSVEGVAARITLYMPLSPQLREQLELSLRPWREAQLPLLAEDLEVTSFLGLPAVAVGVPGQQPLDTLLSRGGLSVAEVLPMLRLFLRDVAQAERRGVPLLSLHPRNLMIGRRAGGPQPVLYPEPLRVADLYPDYPDLRRRAESLRPFRAPEQLRGQWASARADAWACGVLALYFLGEGRAFLRRVRPDELYRALGEGELPGAIDMGSAPGLAEVLRGLLRMDPDERLSAGTALELLDGMAEEQQALQTPDLGDALELDEEEWFDVPSPEVPGGTSPALPSGEGSALGLDAGPYAGTVGRAEPRAPAFAAPFSLLFSALLGAALIQLLVEVSGNLLAWTLLRLLVPDLPLLAGR